MSSYPNPNLILAKLRKKYFQKELNWPYVISNHPDWPRMTIRELNAKKVEVITTYLHDHTDGSFAILPIRLSNGLTDLMIKIQDENDAIKLRLAYSAEWKDLDET